MRGDFPAFLRGVLAFFGPIFPFSEKTNPPKSLNLAESVGSFVQNGPSPRSSPISRAENRERIPAPAAARRRSRSRALGTKASCGSDRRSHGLMPRSPIFPVSLALASSGNLNNWTRDAQAASVTSNGALVRGRYVISYLKTFGGEVGAAVSNPLPFPKQLAHTVRLFDHSRHFKI